MAQMMMVAQILGAVVGAAGTIMGGNAANAAAKAQALMAAGGGTATDPTAMDIAGDIAGETEYNALMALSDGETRARQLEYGGALARYDGQQAKQSSRWKAGTTLLGSGVSMLDKYNPTPNPTPGFFGVGAQPY